MPGTQQRYERLLEAGLALSSELSLPAILQRIVEMAAQITGARYGALGVLGRDGRITEFITTGVTPQQRAAIGDIPVGRGILGVLIDEAVPLRLRDLEQDARSVGFPANHPPMRSFLGAPVTARGQVFGNIFGLRPGILADRRLDQALGRLVEELQQRSGVVAVAEIDPAAAAELAGNAGDLVQLAREALSNVSRHAGAATCRVSLYPTEESAVLEVDDDGHGFDPDRTGGGQGLRNLRERAEALGGRVEIESTPGEGTRVRVTIPR